VVSHHELLKELLSTYGPCGQEDAVRDVCRRELDPGRPAGMRHAL